MRWFRRKKAPAPRPFPAESLGPDLYRHLIRELHGVPADTRRNARWVMDAEWLTECLKLDDRPSSLLLPIPPRTIPVWLLGLPVDVRNDGGAPHLELVTP